MMSEAHSGQPYVPATSITKAKPTENQPPTPRRKRRRRFFTKVRIFGIVIVSLLLIAIALSIGLGVGLYQSSGPGGSKNGAPGCVPPRSQLCGDSEQCRDGGNCVSACDGYSYCA